jgi:hypothetical protein
MAVSSSSPTRRLMISSLPATVSKNHTPSFRTMGIGSGQFWSPISRTKRSSDLRTSWVYWASDLENAANSSASCFGSPDRSSFTSGPKIMSTAALSRALAAVVRALTASFGELKRRPPAAGSSVAAHSLAPAAKASTARSAAVMGRVRCIWNEGFMGAGSFGVQRFSRPPSEWDWAGADRAGADREAGADRTGAWRLVWPRLLKSRACVPRL